MAQRPDYPVLFVDAVHIKVRDEQVTNRPFYVVVGGTVDGHATSSGSGPVTAARVRSTGLCSVEFSSCI